MMSQSVISTIVYEERVSRKDGQNYREKLSAEARRKRQDMQRCPICNVYESLITNVHCVKEHGMTKKEVEAEYGKIMTDGQRNKLKNAQKKAGVK